MKEKKPSAKSRSARHGDYIICIPLNKFPAKNKGGSDRVVCGIYFRSVKRQSLKHSATALQVRRARSMGYQRNFDHLTGIRTSVTQASSFFHP